MHTLNIWLAALWVAGFLTIGMVHLYYWALMNMNRVPGAPLRQRPDASDFTEIGRAYQQKHIRVAIALFAWAFIGMLGLGHLFD
jgi:hypothetical protein